MELKSRSVHAETATIPDEWELAPLESLGNGAIPPIKAGPFGSSLTKSIYVPEGYKVYGQEQVIRGDHLFGDYFISQSKYRELESCAVRPGDVLLSLVGTTGRVLVIPGDASPGVINPRLVRFSFDRKRIDSMYFRYAFESDSIQNSLSRAAQGGTMGVLNAGMLKRLSISVPPIEEQRAIAAALSDVDALIGALDKLIAKKRDLKQAAMQQLLTGQTRLPGFSGEWVATSLGAVANIKTGKCNNEDKVEGGEYPFFVRSDTVERINSYSHDCEAILVPGEGRIGEIFHYIVGRFDVHQRVYAITGFALDISGKFVHLYMGMHFGAWAMQNTVKATVDSLRLPTFQNFVMKVPPTKDEQAAIAQVLSDMDAELAALEARRDKTRALKQGMMQELLTGRIRLPLESAA